MEAGPEVSARFEPKQVPRTGVPAAILFLHPAAFGNHWIFFIGVRLRDVTRPVGVFFLIYF